MIFTKMLICGFQSQRTLKLSHDAAMLKVDELSAQLKEERMKSLDLEKQLQSSTISKIKMEQVTLHQDYMVILKTVKCHTCLEGLL